MICLHSIFLLLTSGFGFMAEVVKGPEMDQSPCQQTWAWTSAVFFACWHVPGPGRTDRQWSGVFFNVFHHLGTGADIKQDFPIQCIYIAYTAAASSCFWGIRSPRSMLGRRRCPMKSQELSRRRLDHIYQSSRYDSGQHVPGYTSYSSIHFQVFMVLLPLNRIKPLDVEAFLAGQT